MSLAEQLGELTSLETLIDIANEFNELKSK